MKNIIFILPFFIILACNSHKTKKIISTIHEPGFHAIEFDTTKNTIHLTGVATNDTLDSLRFYLTIPSLEELKSNQLTFFGTMPFKDGKSRIELTAIDSIILVVKNLNEISPRFLKKFPLENKLGIHKIEKTKAKELLNYFTKNYVNFTTWIEVGVTNGSIESKSGMETRLGFYSLNNQLETVAKEKDQLKEFNYTHIVDVN